MRSPDLPPTDPSRLTARPRARRDRSQRRSSSPHRAGAALLLLATALGCGVDTGDGVDPRAVEGTLAVLVLSELEVFDECDAGNGTPGDFYLAARLTDESEGGPHALEYFHSYLVSSYIAVNALDLELASPISQEAGRALGFAVGFDEYDGGSSYDGQVARAYRYTWQPAEGCWLDFTETECLRPGEAVDFALDLNSDPGASCHATLRYALELVPVTRPAAAYAAGLYRADGLLAFIEHGPAEPGGGVAIRKIGCATFEPIEVVVDPDAESEVTGDTRCKSAASYSGEITFVLEADFASDRDIAGTITLGIDGIELRYPVEGVRTLNTIAFSFAGRVRDPNDAARVYEGGGSFTVELVEAGL